MKRIQAAELFKALSKIPNRDYNRFLLYSIEKSKSVLFEIVQDVSNRERVVIDLVSQYENQRKVMVETYCERDAEGKPVIENENYKLTPENESAIMSKLYSLRTDMNIDSKISEFEAYVQEDVEVALVKTSFKNLPEQIDPELFATLMTLIKETEAELAEIVA